MGEDPSSSSEQCTALNVIPEAVNGYVEPEPS